MNLQTLASMIPEAYRAEILALNTITEAQPIASNTAMHYLFTIWKNYIEPSADLKIECGICLERILKNYRALLPELVALEQKSRLLDKL